MKTETRLWLRRQDSNLRSQAYEACEMTDFSTPPQTDISTAAFPVAFEKHPKSQLTVVDLEGLEPLTPCLQSRCSPN